MVFIPAWLGSTGGTYTLYNIHDTPAGEVVHVVFILAGLGSTGSIPTPAEEVVHEIFIPAGLDSTGGTYSCR